MSDHPCPPWAQHVERFWEFMHGAKPSRVSEYLSWPPTAAMAIRSHDRVNDAELLMYRAIIYDQTGSWQWFGARRATHAEALRDAATMDDIRTYIALERA